MKKILFIPLIIAMFFAFQSCETNGGSKKTYTFEDNKMPSDSIFVFEYNNEDVNQEYDIVLMFRYVQGFQFSQMVFNIEYKADGVEPVSSILGLKVVDKDMQYIGDGSGDIWDIEKTLFSSRTLVKGKSTISLKAAMPIEKVPNVMLVGVKFVKK